ncbi:hypothetical protein L0B53_18695 (plasmid) [Vibrio sp. SS-MA-C1-2]|uniref:Calx-beta domain-containing protein n=1 Tax=Vibrio sp. SS-MA-C1-2 TaxID=2908646 RepID=UPI001F1A3C9D|nr:Calx-beta domain-containing protein [Vibrio sp. SS-MA-C1-2]UJF20350.1 hypothetical protein L0B53_18695 [Vibrio sp. SS-MA-C1-2]
MRRLFATTLLLTSNFVLAESVNMGTLTVLTKDELSDGANNRYQTLRYENNILTVQGNRLVGDQTLQVTISSSATSDIELAGYLFSPGSIRTFNYNFTNTSVVEMPFSIENSGENIPFSISIPQIRSDLDVIPTLTLDYNVNNIERDSASYLVNVTATLDVPIGHTTSVKYTTIDDSAISVAGDAKNIAYDSFGNPFISVVETGKGRIYLDGGFPKYYQVHTTGTALNDAQKLMVNVFNWVKDSSRAPKVLLLGDAQYHETNYPVKTGKSNSFAPTFAEIASETGLSLTTKDTADFGGTGNALITYDDIKDYQLVVVMGSRSCSCTSFHDDTPEAFKTYSNLGGGLIFITDHDVFQGSVNHILEGFGVQFYGNVNRSNVNVNYLKSNYGDHPTWNGLTTVPAGGSEGNINVSSFTNIQPDYEAVAGELIFTEGEVSKSFSVRILPDTDIEDNEAFNINLFEESGLVIQSHSNSLTILNDD